MQEQPDLPDSQGTPAGEPAPPFDTESRQEHTEVDEQRMRDLGVRADRSSQEAAGQRDDEGEE